jgi:hypothetical protein
MAAVGSSPRSSPSSSFDLLELEPATVKASISGKAWEPFLVCSDQKWRAHPRFRSSTRARMRDHVTCRRSHPPVGMSTIARSPRLSAADLERHPLPVIVDG